MHPQTSDTTSYTPSAIEAVGKQIVFDAADAQTEHSTYYATAVNDYISIAPPDVNGNAIIFEILQRHASRLGEKNKLSQRIGSYNWQVQMGNTLKLIAAGITEADNNWADSFKGKVPH